MLLSYNGSAFKQSHLNHLLPLPIPISRDIDIIVVNTGHGKFEYIRLVRRAVCIVYKRCDDSLRNNEIP